MSLKLVIGCGPLPIHPYHKQFIDDSWVLIDLYVKHPKIIKMDARKLEYPALSVEEIYSSHLLEHLAKKEILPTLKEWFRVLKKGGRLRLNVPDFNWAVKCFLGRKKSKYFNTKEKILEIFYGSQEHEGEFHKTGFTKKILKEYLVKAGFKKIKICQVYEAHDMGCLLAEARKL